MIKIIKHIATLGVLLTVIRMYKKITHKIYNKLFKKVWPEAHNISIDPSANIIGHDKINIGINFHAGEHLRMEAVTHYQGKEYMPKIIIKDNVTVNDFVHIAATNYVAIGNNVLMASKIFISDHGHGIYSGNNCSFPNESPSSRVVTNNSYVIIEDNVWLGEFVSILPGVTIGNGSIIGCNSVVMHDIPPGCIAVGSPARVVKKFNPDTETWIQFKQFKNL